MVIDIPDRDIFLLASECNVNTSLFWEYFSDLAVENVSYSDLADIILNFKE